MTAGFFLLLCGILAAPMNSPFSWSSGVGMGVFAAPCTSGNHSSSESGGEVFAQHINVTSDTMPYLASEFDCEGGEFVVHWSGVVKVTDSIVIGEGTTVRVIGNNDSFTDDPLDTSTDEDGTRSADQLEDLTTRLALPRGLTSVALGVGAPPNITPDTDRSDSFGPMFIVESGQLFLEGLIVRGGYAAIKGRYEGGGVYAKNSNVSITGCEITNLFAERSGGGVYVEKSVLVVTNSSFRGCQAGVQSYAGDVGVKGVGGGIQAEDSNVLIDGCLFEGCYASKKGGGVNQERGQLSVLHSVFYENVAGSNNVKDEVNSGDGADLSIKECFQSFGGLAACGANDTVFVNSHVGKKGGAVSIDDDSPSSYIEFHGCTVDNSSAGTAIEGDSQGNGGAVSVEKGATLVLTNCTLKNNQCGGKGGVIHLSPGHDWQDNPGARVILRGSSFLSNGAEFDHGGVVYLGGFANVSVEGDGNVFEGNSCGFNGAVFAGTNNALVTVEGGTFRDNTAKNGGVFWSKGKVTIVAGEFIANQASGDGGVVFASYDSTTTVEGGLFEGNGASNGGVVMVVDTASLQVTDGNITRNLANNEGGAFSVDIGGSVQIFGGMFSMNEADFGGFLFKKGKGVASCTGASILQHTSVDGGAIYAVDDANLTWACDIGNNSALSGSAIYARDSASVKLDGMSLFGNTMARGSVIFLVDSNLNTSQVDFTDSPGSLVLSAVQVDRQSSYFAEDTSFVGFDGEAVIFSEGKIFLDNCDFSGSTSSVLVYTEPGSEAVIRNAVLGDKNYLALATASSQAGELPSADVLTNANLVCEDGLQPSEEEEESKNSANTFPCSAGSECLNGNLGVYCQCYEQRSTGKERCVSGNATVLTLSVASEPEQALYPAFVEGNLLLSHDSQPSGAVASSSSKTFSSNRRGGGNGINSEGVSNGGFKGGVVWKVEALPFGTTMMTWTVFPSTGLLYPGESTTVRVVTLPSAAFDGTTNVTFRVIGMMSTPSITSTPASLSSDDDVGSSSSRTAPQTQRERTSTSLNVTFHHCTAGSFWNYSGPGSNGMEEQYNGTCSLCADGVGGDKEGVDCFEPGSTTSTLRIREGYWRADLGLMYVRECPNKNACKGGSEVRNRDEYCNDGYEGVVCSVCSTGYGRSASNHCHLCTTSFKGVMYFVISAVALLALVVLALLYVYLVRGGGAVSSTVASTKASVRMLQRRSTGILSRPASGVWSGNGHVGLTRSGGLSCRAEDLTSRPAGTPRRLDDNGGGANNNEERNNATTSAWSAHIPAKTNISNDMGGPPKLPAHTQHFAGGKTLERRESHSPPGEKENSTPPTLSANSNEAGVVSDSSGVENSARMFNRTYAGPKAKSEQRLNEPDEYLGSSRSNDGGRETHTGFTKITRILAGLPLSKIKIVIVVWQISSAFAEVTNVTFPPIYERFLSFIGVFSLDLGRILSAACLATEIDFFDKLLYTLRTLYDWQQDTEGPGCYLTAMLHLNHGIWLDTRKDAPAPIAIVTIGPMVLLGLLGVTFHFGASPIRRDIANETGGATPRMFIMPREVFVPAFVNGRKARIIMPKDCVPLPQLTPHPLVDTLEARAQAPSEGGLTGTTIPRAKSNQLWGLFARHATMTLIILYLVYSHVSTVVLQTFACEDYSEISKSYLRADGRIECDTPRHRAYTVYAAVMICLYPLGIPAVFFYLLVRQRSAINPPKDDIIHGSKGVEHVMREKINRRKRDRTIAPTSFLWSAYYPNRYYYEVLECMRRLLLTGLLVFVPDTSGQVAYGCIFAFISLWAFELQKPHIDDLEVQLYRTGCLVIFFTNFLALIIQAGLAEEESKSSAVYSVALIMVHVFFIMSICWNSWVTTRAAFSRDHIQVASAISQVQLDGRLILNFFLFHVLEVLCVFVKPSLSGVLNWGVSFLTRGVVLGVDIVGEYNPGTPLDKKTVKTDSRLPDDEDEWKIEDDDSSPGCRDHGPGSYSSSDMSSRL